jgi:hypothetical protein
MEKKVVGTNCMKKIPVSSIELSNTSPEILKALMMTPQTVRMIQYLQVKKKMRT